MNATFSQTNKLSEVIDFLQSRNTDISVIMDMCNEVDQKVIDGENVCDKPRLSQFLEDNFGTPFRNALFCTVPTILRLI